MGAVRVDGTDLPSMAGVAVREVTFREATSLRLRLVLVRYSTGGATHLPSATDVRLLASWLRRAYPITRLEMTTTTVTADPPPEFTAEMVNAQLMALRAVDVATGTDPRTHYYGMVSDGGFFMRGLASGIPGSPAPSTVASGPTGPGSAGWDFDGSYGDWYGAHELGHTFGRRHVGFCGAVGGGPYPFPAGQLSGPDEAFVGIDVGDPAIGLPMRVARGLTSHDVMTYCSNQWLSSFTYTGIYERLVAEDAMIAGQDGPDVSRSAEAPSAVGLHLIASVNLSRNTAIIAAVLPAPAGRAPVSAEVGEASEVLVRLRDADDTVLDERPAGFTPSACEEPDDDLTGSVDVVLAALSAASVVELVRNGQVLDRYAVGGETVRPGPLARDRAPSGPAVASAAGPGSAVVVDLRWEAPGAPPGQRYIVQVSEDAGASWQTVAVGLREPAVTLHADDFESNELDVRVLSITGTGDVIATTENVTLR